MPCTSRWLFGLVLLSAGLFLAGPAWAVFPPPIKDEGKFFSPEALEKANKKIRDIYQHSKKDVVIETFPAIPEPLEKKFKEEDRNEFFATWAKERSEALGVNGIYILISKKPGRIEFYIDKETRARQFTLKNSRATSSKMLEQFKEKKFDAGLTQGLDAIESVLKPKAGK